MARYNLSDAQVLNWGTCYCTSDPDKYTITYFIKRLFEELVEWVDNPCADEWGDVMLMVTNIIFVTTGIVYIMPYAILSLGKGYERLQQHGCVRSYANRCGPLERVQVQSHEVTYLHVGMYLCNGYLTEEQEIEARAFANAGVDEFWLYVEGVHQTGYYFPGEPVSLEEAEDEVWYEHMVCWLQMHVDIGAVPPPMEVFYY